MTTDFTTRMTGFFAALAMAAALNGGVLFAFDQATPADQAQDTAISLNTVTVIGKRA